MARTYSLEGRVGKVLVAGKRLPVDVAEAVTGGSVSLSASETDQLTLSMRCDPDLRLLRLFTAGTPTRPGTAVSYDGLALEVRALDLGPRGDDHVLTVTARSRGTARLKRRRGHRVWRDLSPTDLARLEAKAVGLRFVGQATGSRKTLQRQKDESSWDAIARYGDDAGMVVFETAGTLYLGRPTWLVQRNRAWSLDWRGPRTDDQVLALPALRRSGDDAKRAASVSVELVGELGERARPGEALRLRGVGQWNGTYMVDGVTLPLTDSEPVSVTAQTPINPEKQSEPKAKKKGEK